MKKNKLYVITNLYKSRNIIEQCARDDLNLRRNVTETLFAVRLNSNQCPSTNRYPNALLIELRIRLAYLTKFSYVLVVDLCIGYSRLTSMCLIYASILVIILLPHLLCPLRYLHLSILYPLPSCSLPGDTNIS